MLCKNQCSNSVLKLYFFRLVSWVLAAFFFIFWRRLSALMIWMLGVIEELLPLLLLLLLLFPFSVLFSLDRSDRSCREDDEDEWWCEEWCLDDDDDELFDLLDELCSRSLSLSFREVEAELDDEWWLLNAAPIVPVIITSELDEVDDVGDDEWCDLLCGDPIVFDDLNRFTLQLLQSHADSCPLAKSYVFSKWDRNKTNKYWNSFGKRELNISHIPHQRWLDCDIPDDTTTSISYTRSDDSLHLNRCNGKLHMLNHRKSYC